MNKNLVKDNYLIIRNFISKWKAKDLGKEFQDYVEKNNPDGDPQAPNSHSVYNYKSFLELLCEKTPEVSKVLKETVVPTYCYARVYKKGSVLEKHTDRDACEISLTIHLGGDVSWPICIKNPKGETKCFKLKPGDAMLYLGKEGEHWRDEYPGESYTQLFLHYVRSRGEYGYAYFDKKDESNKHIDDENQNKRSNVGTKTSSDEDLFDYIQVFDDEISPEDCKMILDEYKDSDEWVDSLVDDGELNNKLRNCMEIYVSMEDVIKKNFDHRKHIDDLIYKTVQSAAQKYVNMNPRISVSMDSGYVLLRYNEGQFYREHTDSYTERPRELSCSLFLNDDYEGGEFAFFGRKKIIKPKTGSVLIFPSNFMFPHEVMPVTKADRYSIVTWFT